MLGEQKLSVLEARTQSSSFSQKFKLSNGGKLLSRCSEGIAQEWCHAYSRGKSFQWLFTVIYYSNRNEWLHACVHDATHYIWCTLQNISRITKKDISLIKLSSTDSQTPGCNPPIITIPHLSVVWWLVYLHDSTSYTGWFISSRGFNHAWKVNRLGLGKLIWWSSRMKVGWQLIRKRMSGRTTDPRRGLPLPDVLQTGSYQNQRRRLKTPIVLLLRDWTPYQYLRNTYHELQYYKEFHTATVIDQDNQDWGSYCFQQSR